MDIKDKIKKLLMLGKSPNENEANLAIAKAYELMLKNKLTEQDINISEKNNKKIIKFKTDIYYTKYKNSYLMFDEELTDLFLVEKYTTSLTNSQKRYLSYIGYEEDIKNIVDIIKFIKSYVDDWFRTYKKNNSYLSNKMLQALKNCYGEGFIKGIKEQLTEKQNYYIKEKGLILTKPEEAIEFVGSLQNDFIDINNVYDESLFIKGTLDGLNCDLKHILKS